MKNIVVYASILDTDEDGYLVDYPYIGGIVESPQQAEMLARDITNDKSIPGITVITRIFEYERTLSEVRALISKKFSQLANQVYDCEDIQKRRESARKKK